MNARAAPQEALEFDPLNREKPWMVIGTKCDMLHRDPLSLGGWCLPLAVPHDVPHTKLHRQVGQMCKKNGSHGDSHGFAHIFDRPFVG